jgi:hypothetical protein
MMDGQQQSKRSNAPLLEKDIETYETRVDLKNDLTRMLPDTCTCSSLMFAGSVIKSNPAEPTKDIWRHLFSSMSIHALVG